MKNKLFLMFTILFITLTSCTNQDAAFDNFEYQSVYFAYQFPVRTITLGEDTFDTSPDNEHKCKIMATLGGVYNNDKDVTIDVEVANSLTQSLLFKAAGDNIVPMPSNYYSLLSNKINIGKGQVTGGVDVQLTDAFFADPLALKNTYVIPIKMTRVVNADTILSGKALVANPNKAIATDWSVAPKDFIFYAVRYVNPWDGNYLRRGKDIIEGNNGNTSLNKTIVRHKTYVESDEVYKINTLSLTKIDFPVVYKDAAGNNINCKLILTFDSVGICTVSSSNPASYTATGTGKFVKGGEKNSWGSKDRDALYLDYKVNLQSFNVATNDTLVLRDRGVKAQTFSPVLK
ncbi:DUF5627 domain-containing protein [Flavobacterium cellulosilyticum]|uniref:DUF1735 domain-containing protein n=1 Tax=Flavobacterium cellulosilyticum TaxID=2541731 RepID=A0A4V6PFC5_9FLAO|nr:DUF5627 domain-containing protein [Flavobacterium cellulosilyticum]TDD99507.1 DUF1735 domain-containing protein [Flavobacterium cellulosilyticum]